MPKQPGQLAQDDMSTSALAPVVPIRPAAALVRPPSRAASSVLLLAIVLFTTALPLLLVRSRPEERPLEELGMTAALLAFGLLGLQTVLSARLPFTDRTLGLSGAMRLHRALGFAVLLLLLAHPALLLVSAHGDIPLGWQVLLGAGALLVLVAGVLAAVLFRFLRMDFNRWRALHRAMILVVVLGGVHGRTIGDDFQSTPALRAWWLALLAGAVGLFVWRNVLLRRFGLRRYRVRSVEPEARGTWTIELVLEHGSPLPYLPGQFMFLTLHRPGMPAEEHPFTISSSPAQTGFIAATIKESGDFTRTIGRTRPGDQALVEGPFGRFSFVHHPADRYLFISAGAGSTPMASMLRFLAETADPRPVLYLCVNRSEADIAFREELADLPASVTVHHVLSQPSSAWTGASGHLDRALLLELAGAWLAGAEVFLCGPPGFVSSVRTSLRELGVPRRCIHAERFAIP